jgi:hypothetical protein
MEPSLPCPENGASTRVSPKRLIPMVRKGVPFYDEIQRMVVELSEYFVRDLGVVYDLGSSKGNA